MKIDKLYWILSNFLEARYLWLRGGRGLLREKSDPEDYLGLIEGEKKTDVESVDMDKYRFDQKHFNICVFAAFTILMSNQNGIRFSVKWLVKLAKREGYITGNGWSFLKAALKCAKKYGMLPYELMPDEIGGQSWYEYSKWTPECREFLNTSKDYKIKVYRKLDREKETLQALNNGYGIFAALTWYSLMNYLKGPNWLIKKGGRKIGGHAITLSGHRNYGEDFMNPQTYGDDYGDKGLGWFESIFTNFFFSKYIVSKLEPRVRMYHFRKFYEGKMVRCKEESACYVIQNGEKFHVPTMELYFEVKNKIGEVNVDETVHKDMLDMLVLGGDYIIQNSK